MRVLLINQFFAPDNAATSQLLTDVALDLVEHGHTVEVICGGSYATPENQAASLDLPGITVHRLSTTGFSRSTLGRIASYATFYLGAMWKAITLSRPDVVLTLTTPPLLSVLGAALKLIKGSRFCIWEMDVYPDVAVNLGYIREGSLVDRAIGLIADWSRRRADVVIVLGECMRDRIVGRGIDAARIAVVHNWADSTQIQVTPMLASADVLKVVYSGNLGLAHDVNTIVGAMTLLKDDERFRFIFIGGGGRRAELADALRAANIVAAELRPYVPREDLSASLGFGDIGLVTQREDCCGSVVPSKVYGLLAAGRPILYIGPERATPARLIREFQCGWHIQLGDSTGLATLLRELANNPDAIRVAGQQARRALEQNFDRHLGTGHIIEHLLVNVPARSITRYEHSAFHSEHTREQS